MVSFPKSMVPVPLYKISPLLDARYIFLSVAVDLLEVRIDDAHAGKLSADIVLFIYHAVSRSSAHV
jgi:hypothetical protein